MIQPEVVPVLPLVNIKKKSHSQQKFPAAPLKLSEPNQLGLRQKGQKNEIAILQWDHIMGLSLERCLSPPLVVVTSPRRVPALHLEQQHPDWTCRWDFSPPDCWAPTWRWPAHSHHPSLRHSQSVSWTGHVTGHNIYIICYSCIGISCKSPKYLKIYLRFLIFQLILNIKILISELSSRWV